MTYFLSSKRFEAIAQAGSIASKLISFVNSEIKQLYVAVTANWEMTPKNSALTKLISDSNLYGISYIQLFHHNCVPSGHTISI